MTNLITFFLIVFICLINYNSLFINKFMTISENIDLSIFNYIPEKFIYLVIFLAFY